MYYVVIQVVIHCLVWFTVSATSNHSVYSYFRTPTSHHKHTRLRQVYQLREQQLYLNWASSGAVQCKQGMITCIAIEVNHVHGM